MIDTRNSGLIFGSDSEKSCRSLCDAREPSKRPDRIEFLVAELKFED